MFSLGWVVAHVEDHPVTYRLVQLDHEKRYCNRLLVLLERVADEPEHRRPQAYEQGATFSVAPFFLVDGLRPYPERYAEHDRTKGGGVEKGTP